MELIDLASYLGANSYPGRGLLLGKSDNGENAVIAYFIMGRSENSRNRVFAVQGDGIKTEAFDPAKCADPSLIIYNPVRVLGDRTIATNGDQTDTIFDGLSAGQSFASALRSRVYEPDVPNFTPRISGLMQCSGGGCNYSLSILKRGEEDSCLRFFYEYDQPVSGIGHLIHTYAGDGSPLPSYSGEPKAVALAGNIDRFTTTLWENLNAENKVSLFVRYIRLADGASKTRIVNKHIR